MTGDEPQDSIPEPPVIPPAEPPPEPYPFWSYVDLLLIAAMTVPCMALGILLVHGVLWLFHYRPVLVVAELLPAQILGYAFVFAAVAMMFRMQYGKPFWRSLAWLPLPLPSFWVVTAGVATAVGVAIAASLLKTPQTSNEITEMMQDRTSLLLLAFFGIAIAPAAEELAFRGFLQPLLVRSVGPIYGILGAAIPFGILHFHEYGNSWRHAVVISLAGVGFGAMRHQTGSTRAAAAMHASYNAFLFLALFSSRKDLPHLW
ncbi:Abortive infection protein [Candidatus Sulfopaludibacter sp. SbA3]|nr:Abortive infection protein [Candidatus Sulfopaludibacter sp. SbA3]